MTNRDEIPGVGWTRDANGRPVLDVGASILHGGLRAPISPLLSTTLYAIFCPPF